MKKSSVFTTRNMVKVAMLGAVAYALMYIEFPLPFIAPPFYKLDFSEVAVLIGGFALGPACAVLIEAIKILLNLLFTGTETMFVGEISNFIVGCAMVVPAAVIYKHHKTKKDAIISLIVGTVTMSAIGFFSNWLAVIPAYVRFMGFELETIISMGQAIFPSIDSSFKLVLLCTTPFNLIKGFAVSLITILIYKHISPLLKK